MRAELRRCADADADAGGDAAAVVGGAPLDLAAAAPAALTVSTEHALGCDGARSSVRRALGLALEGPPTLQSFKSVHFRAPKLGDALRAAGRNAMLYFFFHPAAIGVLVAHNIGEGDRQVAQLPYYPQLQDEGERSMQTRAGRDYRRSAWRRRRRRWDGAATVGSRSTCGRCRRGHERARRHALLRGALPHPR